MPSPWFVSLRPGHWVKNLLLLLPLLAAQRLDDWYAIQNGLLGLISFSLAASALYLHNDLLDLENDRRHPRRKQRPLAAGRISTRDGKALCLTLGLLALLGGVLTGAGFLGWLLAYVMLVITYSHHLKRWFPLDLLALTAFYLLRIAAGASATGTPLSAWLPLFAGSLFLGLALLKRYREMLAWTPQADWKLPAERYRTLPLASVRRAGSLAGALAVGVLLAYSFSDHATLLYRQPAFFCLAGIVLLAWLAYMWHCAGQLRMGTDPVLFAVRDPRSLLAGAALALCIVLAAG